MIVILQLNILLRSKAVYCSTTMSEQSQQVIVLDKNETCTACFLISCFWLPPA